MAKNQHIERQVTDVKAFEHLNKELFKGKLRTPIMVLSSNRNLKQAFFHPNKWRDENNVSSHEIAINAGLKNVKARFFALAHEMLHLWQFDHGTPAKNGYHNKEWVDLAVRIGFKVNGTGYHIETTVAKNGPLDVAIKNMPLDALPQWVAGKKKQSKKERENKSGKRVKYVCSGCNNKAWGRVGLNLICGDCNKLMEG